MLRKNIPIVNSNMYVIIFSFTIDKYIKMTRICIVTRKKTITGKNVSHAHNKTKRRFLTNLHYHRFWSEKKNRYIRIRVSAKGIREIDKKGIDKILEEK
jgi:large subunit ribosomal protein L28